MRDWFTAPEGETDEAHLTPGAFLAYRLQRLGRTAETTIVHSTMLLTFQTHIADQLVRETHARPDGEGFSTQISAPMWNGTLGGAPMAASALELLIAAGARTFIVAGIAGSLSPDVPIGGIVIPTGALREEGTSYHYLPPDVDLAPDPELTEALVMAAAARGITPGIGRVWTTDAIFREMGWKVRRYGAAGILAVEMELSALLAVAQVRGVRLAAVFAISDELFHPWTPGWHIEAFLTGSRTAANIALDVAAATNAIQ
ncbi:MAG: nucleoside phosphorylase [Chloroflexota bacterium]|nr:nucleoside phosphorylase [Chloroflexota bacterium]